MYPKILLAQSIIAICKAHNIEHIVISPGSRNAPLTIGFSNNDYFKCYSIVDERCAAFFALGIAQQTNNPVAVVCTSGSAVLNYYPAIAEAFYSQIPLIILSADRPQNKIDIGDGQTIRQENVFANHSLFNANLTEKASIDNTKKIQTAIEIAKLKKGPVHINIPFEEPLYETQENLTVVIPKIPFITLTEKLIPLNPFISSWNRAKKKIVLIGSSAPNSIKQEYLDLLANDPSVVVMTEVSSNAYHKNFINSIDTLITPFKTEDFIGFCPDILITIGGMIVSKRIKTFLRNYQPKEHWHIDNWRAYDTFGCLSQHFKISANTFFNNFLSQVAIVKSNYQEQTRQTLVQRKIQHNSYMQKVVYSDLQVFAIIFSKLPPDIMLQISNSSAIRYAQLFNIDPSIEVFCNRGTSGIDGSTSTAIGAASIAKKPTLFITGDIGFFYDSNALWNNYIPKNFKIIILNNGGGGIFRILPGHQDTKTFNTFFETTHNLSAKHLSAMYGINYYTANTAESVKENMEKLLDANTPTILEIFTPTKINNQVLSEYFKNLE